MTIEMCPSNAFMCIRTKQSTWLSIAAVAAVMGRRMEAEADLWLRRPLPPDLLNYAAADVACLLPLAQRLEAELQVLNSVLDCSP